MCHRGGGKGQEHQGKGEFRWLHGDSITGHCEHAKSTWPFQNGGEEAVKFRENVATVALALIDDSTVSDKVVRDSA
jgi:hypothetical protein